MLLALHRIALRKKELLLGKIKGLMQPLECVLGDDLDQLARQERVVQRQRKFSGRSLVRLLVFTLMQNPNAKYAEWARTAAQMGIEVSATVVTFLTVRLSESSPLFGSALRACVSWELGCSVGTATFDLSLSIRH